MRIKHLARRNVPACSLHESLRAVIPRFQEHTVCAVTDVEGVVLGRVWRADAQAHPDQTAADVMHPGPSTFRPDVPVAEMAEWFQRRRVEAFLVTTPDGLLWGALYRRDVERMLERHRAHQHAGSR